MGLIEINVSGLREAGRFFTNIPAATKVELKDALDYLARSIVTSAKTLAPEDTGRLRNSLEATPVQETTAGVYQINIGSNLDYAPAMEFGTGPNSDIPGTRVEVNPQDLIGWASRNIVSPDKTPEQLAWAIAKSIKKKGGLLPRRFLRKAFIQNQPTILGVFSRALDKVFRRAI